VDIQQNEGGRQLALAIERRGWSQSQTETAVGVSTGLISRLISGARKPGRAIASKLKDEFGIDEKLWDEPVAARNGTEG
jgi:transcriptional regulator with XRE-family HTH domain